MFDLILKNTLIVDGSKNKPYKGDLGIKYGLIDSIGDLSLSEAEKHIDCHGFVIAPGFIDIHSHGDLSAAAFPNMESCTLQGITTVFGGHCGMSATPVHKYWRHTFFEGPAFEKVIPSPPGGHSPGKGQILESEALRPAFLKTFGFDLDWTHIGEYYDHLSKAGIGANIVCVTGHGQIRQQVLGKDDERFATECEIEEMKNYLREAMENGSRGLSLGLDYAPGVYASDNELIEMAACLKEYDGMLTTHCQRRDFRRGVKKKQYYIDGLKEVMEIALKTGVRLHVSHLSCGYEVLPMNNILAVEAAKQTLECIEHYKKQGVNITWDVIPAGCGGEMFHFPYLATKMIPYIDQCGGLTGFKNKLKLGSYKKELAAAIKSGRHLSVSPFTCLDPISTPEWGRDAVITKSSNSSLEGKNIRELAEKRNQHFVDTILDLLEEDPFICYYNKKEIIQPDNDYYILHPDASICLDGGIYSMNYPENRDYPLEYAASSTYCGMIKFLKAQLKNGASLPETIAKMTGNSAQNIGLKDRGFIKENMAADLVVLNLENLNPNENLVDPRQTPDGIEYVIVNGKIEVDHKTCLYQKAGTPLRYPF